MEAINRTKLRRKIKGIILEYIDSHYTKDVVKEMLDDAHFCSGDRSKFFISNIINDVKAGRPHTIDLCDMNNLANDTMVYLFESMCFMGNIPWTCLQEELGLCKVIPGMGDDLLEYVDTIAFLKYKDENNRIEAFDTILDYDDFFNENLATEYIELRNEIKNKCYIETLDMKDLSEYILTGFKYKLNAILKYTRFYFNLVYHYEDSIFGIYFLLERDKDRLSEINELCALDTELKRIEMNIRNNRINNEINIFIGDETDMVNNINKPDNPESIREFVYKHIENFIDEHFTENRILGVIEESANENMIDFSLYVSAILKSICNTDLFKSEEYIRVLNVFETQEVKAIQEVRESGRHIGLVKNNERIDDTNASSISLQRIARRCEINYIEFEGLSKHIVACVKNRLNVLLKHTEYYFICFAECDFYRIQLLLTEDKTIPSSINDLEELKTAELFINASSILRAKKSKAYTVLTISAILALLVVIFL